jgi:hypothetical protein
MKLKLTSIIRNGKLNLDAGRQLKNFLALNEDNTVIITFEKLSKKRSNAQNSFYWAIVVPMVREGIGYLYGEDVGIEKSHELLKNEFLFNELVNEVSGEIIRLPKSTTELTTIEWELFIEQVRAWASEMLSITIPLPNEQLTILPK